MLLTAFGTGSLLDYFMHRVVGDPSSRVTIIPQFPVAAEYSDRVKRLSADRAVVVPAAQSQAWIRELEPSDWLLIIDPRYRPLERESPLECEMDEGDYAGATYWVASGTHQDDAREIIQRDPGGNVRSIMRCFGQVSGPPASPAMIPYALVPVWAIDELSSGSLSRLRRSLVEREIACRDIHVHGRVLDLTIEENLLTLHDRVLDQHAKGRLPRRFSKLAPGILVGQGAVIHSTARITPPVIVQDNATIERGATIIGPVVLAQGSRVGPSALVARSIVPSSALVLGESSVCHSSALDPIDQSSSDGGDRSPGSEVSPPRPRRARENEVTSHFEEELSMPTLYPAVQRLIDFTVAAISLILLSPLFAILALWVKLDSPGPVFFAHEREGRGGRRFRCWKFRTMQLNAHSLQRQLYQQNLVDGPQFKLAKDPRVTAAGRYLRNNNLDELPQLINVLLGHMSLVGPRPSPFRENQICIPWRRGRLSVRPGITGLWQICRTDRGPGDFQQWIYYDLVYVRHQSLWLDIKILMATILTLGGRWTVSLKRIVPSMAEGASESAA